MATKNYGVKDIEAWEFNPIDLPQEWIDHLGDITENVRILIRGRAKNGKTEYSIRFVKALCLALGKVNYNSTEQVRTSGLKKAIIRNKMSEVTGKFMLCSRDQKDFDVWFKKLQRHNSGRVIVLDSMDYMNLTFDQFKQLNERFPNKAIIMICWHDNQVAKKIEYLMDALVEVKDFVARCVSREGGGKPYIIREKKPVAGNQVQLF
jgi:archaellum biogenesis ATPase FlaH